MLSDRAVLARLEAARSRVVSAPEDSGKSLKFRTDLANGRRDSSAAVHTVHAFLRGSDLSVLTGHCLLNDMVICTRNDRGFFGGGMHASIIEMPETGLDASRRPGMTAGEMRGQRGALFLMDAHR